jgi:hypothetical protein
MEKTAVQVQSSRQIHDIVSGSPSLIQPYIGKIIEIRCIREKKNRVGSYERAH